MLNPLHMTRLADLLRQGTIMRKFIQPYESHLQYLAQWMCDYNLYGCAYIESRVVRFRSPVPRFSDLANPKDQWHDQTVPTSWISDDAQLPRQSHCAIEVDICVQDINNRLDVVARPLHHDFIEHAQTLISDAKLVPSMAGLWRDERRRRSAKLGMTEGSPFDPETLVSVSADPRNSQPGGWIHEEEYAERIFGIIQDEKVKSNGEKLAFDTFIEKAAFERQVKTSMESVDDLFPGNIKSLSPTKGDFHSSEDANSRIASGEAEVDETRVRSFVEDEHPYDSDEELACERGIFSKVQTDRLEKSIENECFIGLNEQMNTDINHEEVTVQSQNSPNSTTFEGVQGPTSSTELDSLGIRNANNYHSYVDEDSFAIPFPYMSETKFPSTRYMSEQKSQPPLKKRKFIHNEQNTEIGISGSYLQSQACQKPSKLDEIAVLPGVDNRQTASSSANTATPSQEEPSKKTYSVPNLSSQENNKADNVNYAKTLPIPSNRDRQDPLTILRLSQQSGSAAKDFQGYEMKPVSIDTQNRSSYEGLSSLVTTSPSVNGSSLTPSLQVSQAFSQAHEAFSIPYSKSLKFFYRLPPVASDIISEMRHANIPPIIYQDPYYSDEKDVPERTREYAGKEFKIESSTVPYLPDFDPTNSSPAARGEKACIVVDKLVQEQLYRNQNMACDLRIWEMDGCPPTRSEVQVWLERDGIQSLHESDRSHKKEDLSQIDSATQRNRHGFKFSQKQHSASVQHEIQYMSIMSLEVHIATRGNLVPNPEHDEIGCVFWCIQSDDDDLEVNGLDRRTQIGVIALSADGVLGHQISQQTTVQVVFESNELDLINHLVDIVRNHDPDILTGYEVHGGSWGFVMERARFKYDYDLCDELSRMKSDSHGRFGKASDKWGFNQTSTIRVTGRHMINIWRAMRGELNLLQYTMENVVFHLLHRRIPHYPYKDLTFWYSSNKPRDLAKVIQYYILRVQLDLEILEQNELISRTSEQARLLGVDFFSVFSRGSQFKVESLMFRIAKPENFMLPSPSRKQVGQQNALECLPLVMEPQSAYYSSPLLVLDFQSLYPSVMIAYNYCYSTFLGRVVSWRGENKMGFADYQRQHRILELLGDQINIAPNGMIYAKPSIRKSLLAKMLGEILETRVMIKTGMKADKDDKALQRLLNNRQLALKLISNVTYGYTSASFSGRMPCSEIADSIVQTGRETLEKAIALIHSVEKWGAEVVYGDTDSLFVYLKGRTKEEAFNIGDEIAKTITSMNPRPVKLKFEKVYLPCILLAKKRYVGFKYEYREQKEPDFDAKGIETVRRDGTPAEQKIEEKALKILFRTADLSQVKSYFQKQCTKIMKGKVSVQDFCFAKEVRLGTYSNKGILPPGAMISTRRMLEDPRAEPQYGERVPYVVITGAPGARLIDRCVAPEVLLNDDQNELDAEYYISKNLIPPLERIFNLMGANIRQWYDEVPKIQRIRRVEAGPNVGRREAIISKKTLESYLKSSACLVCWEKLEEEMPICSRCMQKASTSLMTLRSRLNKVESKAFNLEKTCRSCAGLAWGEEVKCDSKDCAVFYSRVRRLADLRNSKMVMNPVISVLEDMESDLDW